MYTQAIYYAIPLLFGATVALAFCFLALQRYREAGALAFVAGMAGVALWSFAYAFELLSPTLLDKMVWHRIIYTASSAIPAFWLLFLLQHEYNSLPHIRLWATLLMIEPVVYTFLTWTNDTFHQLLWRNIELVTRHGLLLMNIERGTVFYLHIALTYSLVCVSVVFFLRILRRESSVLTAYQMLLLVLGVLAAVIANALHLIGITPGSLNLTPFALISMGAAVGWFAFRFDLWDILPAAHDAVFDGMGDGVIVLTLNHIVIDLNPAAYHLLGLPKQSFVGKRIHDIVARYAYFPQLQAAIDDPPASGFKTIAITVDRPKQRHLDIVVSLLRDRRQRITGRILTLRDVTAHHNMAQMLEQERTQLAQRVEERTQELSQANAELAHAARLKDEFLANMSHELRTPLNTVLGLSEALQDEVYGDLSPKQDRALQHILDGGRHLLALINDILDVSKIEAGKLQLDPGPVAIDSLCESSVNFIRQHASKKHLRITIDVDPVANIVYGDERRLKQILVNLLSNAVKFTPDNGEIGIQVTGDPADDVLRFTIWDTGIGIAETDMSELFKPFVQLDSRLTRAHEGTGLGLTLVHRMVDLHGGSITVESTPRVGSKFIVALPWIHRTIADMPRKMNNAYTTDLREQPQLFRRTALSNDGRSEQSTAKPLILLIEDNENNVNTFSDYLVANGYQIVVARSGAEALIRLVEVMPELILLDIQMPDIDGYEVAKQIRAHDEAYSVPIVALTALAMPGDRERCLAVGMNDYLSKPVSLRRLIQVVERYLAPIGVILAD